MRLVVGFFHSWHTRVPFQAPVALIAMSSNRPSSPDPVLSASRPFSPSPPFRIISFLGRFLFYFRHLDSFFLGVSLPADFAFPNFWLPLFDFSFFFGLSLPYPTPPSAPSRFWIPCPPIARVAPDNLFREADNQKTIFFSRVFSSLRVFCCRSAEKVILYSALSRVKCGYTNGLFHM